MIKTFISFFLMATSITWATCPTVEFLGEFEAIPQSCEYRPHFFLKSIRGEYRNDQMKLTITENPSGMDVALIRYNAISDEAPGSSLKCIYTDQKKSIGLDLYAMGDFYFILENGEYLAKYGGCMYVMMKNSVSNK